MRSRVRSAGARQRRGGASADGSPRTAAAPQELRENAQVPFFTSHLVALMMLKKR